MANRFISKRAFSTVRQYGAIEKQSFGTTKCGKNVELFSMSNAKGMTIEILNYGAHLRTVNVPDRDQQATDVTIGLSNISDYEERNDYFGCIAGRFANRIDQGKFKLSQKSYQLSLNDGVNSLHGGFEGMCLIYASIHYANLCTPQASTNECGMQWMKLRMRIKSVLH